MKLRIFLFFLLLPFVLFAQGQTRCSKELREAKGIPQTISLTPTYSRGIDTHYSSLNHFRPLLVLDSPYPPVEEESPLRFSLQRPASTMAATLRTRIPNSYFGNSFRENLKVPDNAQGLEALGTLVLVVARELLTTRENTMLAK